MGAVCLHAVFWAWLANEVSRRSNSSSVALTALLGIWVAFAWLIPAATQTAIERSVPIPEGVEILLTQREAVNGAWDRPKSATMKPFVQRHPEWRAQSTITKPFEWKWYFAFQQVGDQRAETQSQAYRSARVRRNELAGALALLSPPAWTQRMLQRLARTDVKAALAYEQSVRDFHAELRDFFYPRLFRNLDYSAADATRLPSYQPHSP